MFRRRVELGTPNTSESEVERERHNVLSDDIPAQLHENVREPPHVERLTQITTKENAGFRRRRNQQSNPEMFNIHIYLFIGQMVFFIMFAIIMHKTFKIVQANNTIISPKITITTTTTVSKPFQDNHTQISTVTSTLHRNIIHSSTVTETEYISYTEKATVTETAYTTITRSSTVTKTMISTIYRPFYPKNQRVNRKWFGKPPLCGNHKCPYGSRQIVQSHYPDTESRYSPCLLKNEKKLDGRLNRCLDSWSLNCWQGESVLCEAPVDPNNPTAFPG